MNRLSASSYRLGDTTTMRHLALASKYALVWFFAGSMMAQLTLSTIRGTVADPTGAVVGKVEVALINLETNARWSATSNQNGDFEIPDLQPGKYRLTAVAPGFKQYVADQILLESNQI